MPAWTCAGTTEEPARTVTRQQQIDRVYKPLLFLVCLLPFLRIVAGAFGIAGQALGVNPVEDILHSLGLWGLRFLVLTLLVVPVGYSYVEQVRDWLAHRKAARQPVQAPAMGD